MSAPCFVTRVNELHLYEQYMQKGGDSQGNKQQSRGCVQSAEVTPLDSSTLEMDGL